jgi:transcriptional regulator with XRE-family HTH domain
MIGKKLYELIENKGITAYKIAKDININKQTVLNYIKDINIPTLDNAKKIADYFGVTLDYLVSEKLEGDMEISEIGSNIMKESDDSIYHYTNNFDGLINIFKKKIKPHYSNEDYSYMFGKERKTKTHSFEEVPIPYINAVPIFSLCDIPENRHELHQKLYGHYGIGFEKKWAKENFLNPVIYCHPRSYLAASLRILFSYFLGMNDKENNEREMDAYKAFNCILMSCKPYDNEYFLINKKEERRCYDEKEWRYIGWCDEISLSIWCKDRDRTSLRNFIKEKNEAQDKIMRNAVSDETEITLKFTIDDITHIILPTEEKKEEFIKEIEKIEEYVNDMNKIKSLIRISYKKKHNKINTNSQNSENNSGTGIIGNNVNGGGINDNKIIQEMVDMLKKKDEQIDKLLQIIQKDK